ncbi:MAG: response regulator, partial [Thalassovita sp.]|nr:response regulator [Thalassovita sp.]
CSPVRFDRFGLISANTYRIQIFPMMTSELYHALAVLSGRKKDELHDKPRTEQGSSFDLVPQNHRILVVEDNEINKAVLSKQLEIMGYPHELASDGMEGFSKWKSGDFDLVLTDCHMPRMDGFELVASIRHNEQQHDMPPVPIIAITANALEGEAEKCLASGMNAYLAKPVELEALKSQMSKLLRSQQRVKPS